MVVFGNPYGDVNVIPKLVAMGGDLTMKDEEGWTCLHWAAYHNNVAAVEVLLESLGSEKVLLLLTEKDKKDHTPYEVAKEAEQKEFCSWIRTTMM